MPLKHIEILLMLSVACLAISLVHSHNENQMLKQKFNSERQYPFLSSHRMKRRLEDIATIIKEDEFMALLVCDVCLRNKCMLQYCIYCDHCSLGETAPAQAYIDSAGSFIDRK